MLRSASGTPFVELRASIVLGSGSLSVELIRFEVTQDGGGATIRQTAGFDPSGLAGLLYWYGVTPLHVLVFRGTLREIAARATL